MENSSALDGMKRAELQRLAKKAGIKANMKTDAIIEALRKHYQVESIPTTGRTSSGEDDTTGNESAVSTSSESAGSSVNEGQVEQDKTCKGTPPKRVARKGRKGRKRTVAPTKNTAAMTTDKTPEQKSSTSAVKLPNLTVRSNTPRTRCSTASSTTLAAGGVPLRRQTRSVTPKTGSTAPATKITLAPVETSVRRKTRSVTPKMDKDLPTASAPTDVPVRRRTYEIEQEQAAPHEVAKKETTAQSDPDMKREILAELEQKAAEKLSLQSKIPKRKAVVAKSNKPITPGNKDWSRIHQAQFDKMESIDDYVARKRKRTEALSASVKRAKLIADEARAAVQNLTSHRTPQGSSAKVGKPVSRVHITNLPFGSPRPTGVKNRGTKAPVSKAPPTKSVTFKVSRLKTPTRASVLLVGGGEPRQKRKSTPGPRKSISVIDTSAKKPQFDLSSRKSIGESGRDNRKSVGAVTTPFKFGQSALTPAADTISKPAFDLKASLSKPLTYKPYTGKLKPLEVSTRVQATSNIQKAKANITKKPMLKTRDNRRAEAKHNRANKRANNLMARRGISAF
ncbi:nucleolar and spindle-associated protein 1-B-like [Acanthaster planci]|uniref:Nucleolar and spindle-associated protein 1-B-like n=1 Tax=Acanthaster planci TaxID=133434 RepID=A0A8B7XYE1_ACAPL|nr:nucleolar and spindle-associated protein 1-B-like [Acanthaster planci]